MNYTALRLELQSPIYASMTDQEAADAINAKTVSVRALVPCGEIVHHASINGYRHKLTKAASNENHPCQGLAIDIIAYIDSTKTVNVDMDLPETQGMLAAMVQCGFATEAIVASLDALANKTIKWTEANGTGYVEAGHVGSARGMI